MTHTNQTALTRVSSKISSRTDRMWHFVPQFSSQNFPKWNWTTFVDVFLLNFRYLKSNCEKRWKNLYEMSARAWVAMYLDRGRTMRSMTLSKNEFTNSHSKAAQSTHMSLLMRIFPSKPNLNPLYSTPFLLYSILLYFIFTVLHFTPFYSTPFLL